MRMAKSWGHGGGRVPAATWTTILAHRADDGGEKAVPENIQRTLMRVRPTPPAHRRTGMLWGIAGSQLRPAEAPPIDSRICSDNRDQLT
jgi:hypothetical protein